MDSNLATIESRILRWPGVTSAPGRFGAGAFRYGKREIGHIHRGQAADLPVAREMREGILTRGRAHPHRARVKGYVSYPTQHQEDVSVVLEGGFRAVVVPVQDLEHHAASQEETEDKA